MSTDSNGRAIPTLAKSHTEIVADREVTGERVQASLHIALLDTAYFTFMAGGLTADHARASLERAWHVHAAQTGATYTWAELADDVIVVTLKSGEALRDMQPISFTS